MRSAAILTKLTNPASHTAVGQNINLIPIIFSFLDEKTLVLMQLVTKLFNRMASAAIAHKISTDYQCGEQTITFTCLNTHTADGANSLTRFKVIFQDEGNRTVILPVLDIGYQSSVEFKLHNLGDIRNPVSFVISSEYRSATVRFVSESDPDKIHTEYFKKKPLAITNKLLPCPEEKVIRAIQSGDATKLENFLKNGIAANTCDKSGNPLLTIAGTHGKIECAKTLLDYKANVDARDVYGATTLMSVVFDECTKRSPIYGDHKLPEIPSELKGMIDLLIARKADVNAQSKLGQTILHYLAQSTNGLSFELANYFLERGADPCVINGASLRPACTFSLTQGLIPKSRRVTNLLFRTTMPQDALPRIEAVEFTLTESNAYCYTLAYKKGLPTVDKRFAWEAIVNKLKSIATEVPSSVLTVEIPPAERANKYYLLLGLASDDTACYFGKDQHDGQLADTEIPDCYEYAIDRIDYKDENSFVILVKPVFSILPVHAAIVDGLKELKLIVENKTARAEFDVADQSLEAGRKKSRA